METTLPLVAGPVGHLISKSMTNDHRVARRDRHEHPYMACSLKHAYIASSAEQ